MHVLHVVEEVEQPDRVAEVDQEPGHPGPREVGVGARRDPERRAANRRTSNGSRPARPGSGEVAGVEAVRHASARRARRRWRGSRPRCCRSPRDAGAADDADGLRDREDAADPAAPLDRHLVGDGRGDGGEHRVEVACTPHQPSAITDDVVARPTARSSESAPPTRAADDPRQPPAHPQRRPVGERAEQRVADRPTSNAPSPRTSEEDRLLVVRRRSPRPARRAAPGSARRSRPRARCWPASGTPPSAPAGSTDRLGQCRRRSSTGSGGSVRHRRTGWHRGSAADVGDVAVATPPAREYAEQ